MSEEKYPVVLLLACPGTERKMLESYGGRPSPGYSRKLNHTIILLLGK